MINEEISEEIGEEIDDATESEEESEEAGQEDDEGSEEEGDEEQSEESDEEEQEEKPTEKDEDEVDSQQLYQVTVDGQSFEVTLEEMATNYQLKAASYKRMEEAANREKSMDEFVDLMKSQPLEALKASGMQGEALKQFFYETAKAMLEEEQMPEEERRAKELAEENARLKAEAEERSKKEAEAEFEKETIAAKERLQEEFTEALDAEDIPSTPAAIRRVAELMYNARVNNQDLSVAHAAAYYKEEQAQLIRSQLGGLSGEQLTKLLGKDAADQIRKNDIAKVKNPSKKTSPPKARSKKKDVRISAEDFFDNFEG